MGPAKLLPFLLLIVLWVCPEGQAKTWLVEWNAGYQFQLQRVEAQQSDVDGPHGDLIAGLTLPGPFLLDFRLLGYDNAWPDFVPVPLLFTPLGLRTILNLGDLIALELGASYQYVSFLKLTRVDGGLGMRDLRRTKKCLPGAGKDPDNTCTLSSGASGHFPDHANTGGTVRLRGGLFFNFAKTFQPHLFVEYARLYLSYHHRDTEDVQYLIIGAGLPFEY
ncbi:MAG: hypothetical protein A2284_07280 [Deltaproteobacteria bacterium RIFOXYA12_FULL_61_11]|nr:MAG: hypothetical protein A2284_07280 [Deltaproteobacteria bacterium RIFOXYA12_FULL_61_11]